MNTEVVKVLMSWNSSLDHYEKLDDWKLPENLSVLGAYLRTKDENVKVMRLVKQIRDKALCPTFDLQLMKELLHRFFDMVEDFAHIRRQSYKLFLKYENCCDRHTWNPEYYGGCGDALRGIVSSGCQDG